jgi:Domain of unknown function (DUF1963)
VRLAWPDMLKPLYQLPLHRLSFSVSPSITDAPDLVPGIQVSPVELAQYFRIYDTIMNPENAWDFDSDGKGGEGDGESPSDGYLADGVIDDSEEADYGNQHHHLLGYPVVIHHGAMPLRCEVNLAGQPHDFYTLESKPLDTWSEAEKARLAQAYERWQLLFQVGNVSGKPAPLGGEEDDDPVWGLSELCDLWARGGLMYFWIERDRLAQRDFSNVWLLGASEV